jgi:hypothetical protein
MTTQNAAAQRPAGPPPERPGRQALHDKEQTTMTDQEIVAGRGENAEASGTLGLNFYGLSSDGHVQTLFSSADVGQGSGAVAWLTGNFVGGPIEQIAQLWDNGGNLGLNLYGPFGTLASFPDLGQGSGAVAWLAGNFFGGSTDAIAQLWDNGGNLGLNVYQMAGDNVRTVIASSDLGQGSGAVAWLTGDFTGSGYTEIAQLWDNGGNLGLNVYGMAGGTVQTVFESSDLGQGSGALAWLTGDFSDVGTTEIAQLWDDNGTLALTVYRYEQGTMVAPVGNDLGQGTGAVAWLTGDFFGRGSTQIVQLWDNDGTLGAVVYGCVNGTAETLFGSSDLLQGSGAVAWLTGNFTGWRLPQIAQLWDNDGTLSVLIYSSDGNDNLGLDPFHADNLGQGPGALAWLTGDFSGSGLTQIAQPWDS